MKQDQLITGNVLQEPLLQIYQLEKYFNISGSFFEQLRFKAWKIVRQRDLVHAINNVSFDVQKGEALCVVGESGCGKSTLGRTVMGLLQPSAGSIHYAGERIDNLPAKALLPYRKKMQMIFQNPYASLNPRKTIDETLAEPIHFHKPHLSKAEVKDQVQAVMHSVGIDTTWGVRYPHEFSGGQRQRISIARALTVEPEFIVADEPISALDVSIQAQVLNLMMETQEKHHLTYLFITHDLAVVEHFAERVVVMYLGKVCEIAATKTLFDTPKHPYTQALMSAIPRLDDNRPHPIKLYGEVPTPIKLPSGCVFHGRCPYANDRCQHQEPELLTQSDGSQIACHAQEEKRL